MPIRYVCAECGVKVSLPNERQGLRNPCPHCEKLLPDHPAKTGSVLVIGIVAAVSLLGCFGVGGLATAFWLVAKDDGPEQKQVAAQVEPEARENPDVPIENPAPRVEEPDPPVVPALPKDAPPPVVKQPERPDQPHPAEAGKKDPPLPVFPGQNFNLPPLPNPVHIRPSPIAEEKTFRLPEPWERSVIGGSGRFIVMQFPKTKKIGIFDVNIAKISAWIDLAEDQIQMAAGMSKLFVFFPSAELVRRYDLATGKEETSQPLRLKAVTAFTMGHSSAGPLVIRSSVGARLYDANTFAEILIPNDPDDNRFNRPAPPGGRTLPLGDGEIFAGGNGRVFGNNGRSTGFKSVSLEEGKVTLRSENTGTGYVFPCSEGKHIFAAGHKPLTVDLKPTADTIATGLDPNGGRGEYLYVPAAHGPFYLQIAGVGKRFWRPVPAPAEQSILVFLYGLNLPVANIGIPPELGGEDWDARLTFAASTLLVPRANVLVFRSKDSLRLVSLDWEKGLEKTGEQFLLVSSAPPARYQPGAELRYAIQAKSKAGGVQFKIESGSEGMSVDAEGVLTWKPPDSKKDPVDVVVSVKDKAGKEATQRFLLTPEAAGGPAVAMPDPVVPKEVAKGPDDGGRSFPPSPARLPVKALDSKERRVYTLPSATDRAIPAGGGRFLVLHFANRTVGVFDVNEGKIVRFIPMAEDRPLFAAGMSKLVVYLPSAKLIQRYSLLTGERELSKELDFADVKAMAMGAASAGPIVAATASGGRILDLETFAEIDVPKEENGDRLGRPVDQRENRRLPFRGETLSASADGRVFAGEGGVAWIAGHEMKMRSIHGGAWMYAQPSSDGKYVFHGGNGALTVTGEKTADVAYSLGERGGHASYFFLPSVDGPFYFHIHFGRFRATEAKFRDDPDRGLSVYMYGVDVPIARILGIREMPEYGIAPPKGMPLNEQLHLFSRAKQMLVFGSSRDRITIIPIDPIEALGEAGIDRLLITSMPPGAFKPGAELIYPVRARSKSGGFKFNLDSGPAGMKISPLGVLSWSVPAKFDEREVSVIMSVKDADGREAFHSFRLARSEKNVEYTADPEPEPAKDAALAAKDDGPRVDYALPTAPAADEFDSTLISNRAEIAVPHKYDLVVAGGGGRYLILHAKAARKAMIFDMADKAVKHTIDLGEENALVAAGMSQMLVYRPSTSEIEKFSLAAGKSEGKKPITFKNATEMRMGSASAGPLLIRSAHHAELYDADKLQPMKLPKTVRFPFVQGQTWVSANGRVFGNTGSSVSGPYLRTAILEDAMIRETTDLAFVPYAVPSFDGGEIYLGGLGERKLPFLAHPQYSATLARDLNDQLYSVPAHSPNVYLMLHLETPPSGVVHISQKATNRGVTIVSSEPRKPSANLPETFRDRKSAAVIPDMPELMKELLGSPSLPMLVHYKPEANALAAVPASRDKIVIYPVQIEGVAQKAKRAIVWRLPELPAAVPPKIPPIVARKSIILPGKILQTAVGGAGRFLVFQVESSRLAVLDLVEGKWLPEVPAQGNIAGFAATLEKLVVVTENRDGNTIRRYDLLSGKLEALAGCASGRYELAAGSASMGPIVLSSATFPTQFIDLNTLAPMKLPDASVKLSLEGRRVGVSADGRTIVAVSRATVAAGEISIVQLTPKGIQQQFGGTGSVSYVALSPDGKYVFVGGGGIVGPDLKPVAGVAVSPDLAAMTLSTPITFVPAVEGPYYLHVHLGRRPSEPKFEDDPANGLTVYKYGVEKPLGRLANLIELPKTASSAKGSLMPPWIYYFYPSAKLLTVVDQTARKIHFVPLDPENIPPLAPPAPKTDPNPLVKPKSKTPKTRPKTVEPDPVPVPKTPPKPVDPNAATMADSKPFRHTPLPEPLPIKPAAAATFAFAERARMSPARFRLAGGGRFVLIQRNPDNIDVFDVNEGKVVRQIGIGGNKQWLAGMTKLFVFEDSYHRIRRFDLLTGKEELARTYANQVVPLAMGMSTNGPIAVRGREGIVFIDGESLALMTFPKYTPAGPEFFNKSCWASPDGRAYGVGMGELTIAGPRTEGATITFILGPDGVRKSSGAFPSLYAVPDPTGRYLFAGGHGVYDISLAKTPDAVRSEEPSPREPPVHIYLPATDGPFYLKYPVAMPIGGVPMPPQIRDQQFGDIEYSIYAFGQSKPVAQMKAPDPFADRRGTTMGQIRDLVQVVTSANALVIVSGLGDKIHVVPVDLNAEMKKSGIEVPWVSSSAPRTFKAGEAIVYPIKLHGGPDGTEFSIDAPLPGMSISKDGIFQWTPAADAPPEAKPLIRLKRAGKESVYSFVLTRQ